MQSNPTRASGTAFTEAHEQSPTRLGAAALARAIASRSLRAVDVLEAHLRRIDEVDRTLNAVTLRRFDEARREAEQADRKVRAGEPLGPLHGVPITVKECLDVEGTAATFGIDNRDTKAPRDAAPIARLRAAGAIVVAKTNVAQHLMFFETDNPRYGKTNHPLSAERSPGGSSGGEAALIASFASPLGVGTDLGGSVRNPANACGIVGFKPTAGRLPDLGTGSAPTGQTLIASQVGTLARSVEDVALGLRVAMGCIGDRQGDLPSLGEVSIRGLRVVVLEDDGIFSPCPAARRAVREARDCLVAAGATVVTVKLPDRRDTYRAFYAVMSADGTDHMRRVLAGSRIDPRVQQLIDSGTKPRAMVNFLLKLTHRHAAKEIVSNFSRGTAAEYFATVDRVRLLREHALDAMANADVVLSPASPLPAVRHGACIELGTLGSYTTVWNVLGWPAGVVPWTTVRAGEETDRSVSNDPCNVTARETERDSVGLPIGVQISAAPYRDHTALAALRALEQHQH